VQLVLIRHARPVRVELEHGPADPELSDLGHRQAKALAEWLADEPIDALYVSPMRRARETAEPVSAALGLPMTIDDGIAEYDRDASEYIPVEELRAAGDDRWREIPEDIDHFQSTVVEAIEAIVERHPSQRVALVCHGGVINVFCSHILGTDNRMFFLPGYTSIHRVLAASTGERSIETLNETAHLRGVT
jgi:probable phosphoglycerate mutase